MILNSNSNCDNEFGSNIVHIRVTDQIKELQTVIRDRFACLLFFADTWTWC